MDASLTPPSLAFQRAYREAVRTGGSLTIPRSSVVAYPPTAHRQHWRIVYRLDGRRETTCPDDVVLLFNKIDKVNTRCILASSPKSYRPVSEMIDAYLDQRESTGWRPRTRHDRQIDTDNLRHVCVKLRCVDLDVDRLREAVNRCGTSKRGMFVRKQLAAMLTWAANQDWISDDQARLIDKVEWKAPRGWTEPKSRRAMARQAGSARGAVDRGEVPTAAQVSMLAQALAVHYREGEGLIELDAVTGLRLGELIPLTADPNVAARGEGNYVDLATWEIQVRVQVDDRDKTPGLPKAGKVRDVVIPRTAQVPTGFDARAWLARRASQALGEQAAGTNPRALYFPSPRGVWWSQGNLTRRFLHKAYSDLGWPTTTITDKNGRVRVWQRWSIHSLRDAYACTAVDRWKYSENQLFEQGGWADRETVARYYLGVTDDTHAEVRNLVG